MSAKFLLIQNHEGLRKAKSMVFGGAYFHTLNFVDDGALEDYLAKEPVDVILADTRGSGGGGLDFVDHIRKGQPKAKIVLVSDGMELPQVIRSIRLGVKEVFQGNPDTRALAKCLGDLAAGGGAGGESLRKADWAPLTDFFNPTNAPFASLTEFPAKNAPPPGVRRDAGKIPARNAIDEELAKEKETLASERVRLADEAKKLKDASLAAEKREQELRKLEKLLAERDRQSFTQPATPSGDAKKSSEALAQKLESAEKDLKSLGQRLAEESRKLEEANRQLHEREAELMTMEQDLLDARKRADKLSVEAKKAPTTTVDTAAVDSLKEQQHVLQERCEKLVAERDELAKRIEAEKRLHAELSERLREKKHEAEELAAERDDFAKRLENEKRLHAEISEALQDKEREISELSRRLETARHAKVGEEEERFAELRRSQDNMISRLQESEQSRAELSERLQSEKKKFTETIRQLEEEISALERTISESRTRHTMADGEATAELRKTQQLLTVRLEEAERERTELSERLLNEKKKFNETIRQREAEIAALERTLSESRTRHTMADGEVTAELRKTQQLLTARLEEADRDRADLVEKIAAETRKVHELLEQLDQKDFELKRFERQLAEREVRQTQSESGVVVELRKAQTQLAAQLQDAELEKARLNRRLNEAQSLASSWESRAKEVERVRAEKEHLVHENDSHYQTQIRALKSELELVKEEASRLKASLDRTSSALSVAERNLELRTLELAERTSENERRAAEWEMKRLQLEQRERQLEAERKVRAETAASEDACASDRRLRLLRNELAALAAALAERETALRKQEAKVEGLVSKADADLRQAATLETHAKARQLEAQERLQQAEKRAQEIIAAAQARTAAEERARSGLTEALMLERDAVKRAEERYVEACTQVSEQMQVLADREAQMRKREFHLEERELAMRQMLQRVMSDTSALRRGENGEVGSLVKDYGFKPEADISNPRAGLQMCDETRGEIEEGHRAFADQAAKIASLSKRINETT